MISAPESRSRYRPLETGGSCNGAGRQRGSSLLVEEAHGQGHPSPMLDAARRRVRAVAPAFAAPVVLVSGEGSAMDRELSNRKSSAVVPTGPDTALRPIV